MKPINLALMLLLVISLQFTCHLDRTLYQSNIIENGTYIHDWLLCGPFPNCEGCSRENYEHDERCKGFFTDYLQSMKGEKLATPAEGTRVTVPEYNLTRTWFYYHSETEKIPFNEIFEPNDLVVAYAFCRIESETERKAILSVGSNDGIAVWFNGEKVHENHCSRWLQPDNDYVPVMLQKGKNRLLIKVDEGTGDFGFAVRFLDYDSTISNLTVNLKQHQELTLVTQADTLVAQFGTPYKIGTLNPGAEAVVEVFHERTGKIGEQRAIPGTELRFLLTDVPQGFLTAKATFETQQLGVITSEKRHFHGKLPRHPQPRRISKSLAVLDKTGQPYFPIGTYGAIPEEYSILKAAGLNFVVAGTANLDKVHAAGLKAAVPVHGHGDTWFTAVRDTIAKYKSHPAILCWMLFDEPGYNRADLLDIHKIYTIAYETDRINPSYLVITSPTVYGTHGRCCDVLAVDTYPVSRGTILHVGDNIKKAYTDSDGDQPVWHCGQLFPWPKDRLPTAQEHRFMTYLALLEGSKGMLWYSMRFRGYEFITDAPDLWEAHKVLLNELNTLSPLWIAPGFGKSIKATGDEGLIRAKLKTSPVGTFLIAVNTSKEKTIEPTLHAELGSNMQVRVFGEDRTIPVKKGTLHDRFEPLDVHIYQLSGE
ncbi:hypothetical protein JXJ21_12015 [candidate division KSB1 bacterium]|nr:hypothetical protein [candidate division KSB1 bacterium]